ncbi:GH15 family glucan-1,4-alpha-glucosidase [Streptomonospora nanhaiensis]|uniref:Trehalase n=1 Tax=Streptomonospora nanhaiensis TaxID=1323731 RepID=A0A853BWZ8_9ACTN|nr:glycoside hydrolase family 15 protein [Streptomonospora nanhaiensis]NYI98702.1 GH15 family glucan-1,4-alpha-glucosidase [Streptomonospora nanhaiensis]
MPLRIEDYALIGDTQTAALVGTDGSIDWLCLPRFDSGACFAALLGDGGNGYWRVAPAGGHRLLGRRYRPDSLVLETEFAAEDGVVRVTDCMPVRDEHPDLVRRVEGVRGRVRVRTEIAVRPDYGAIVPWTRKDGGRLSFVAGPDTLYLASDLPFDLGEAGCPTAEFTVEAGEVVDFRLAWVAPQAPAPARVDVGAAIERTERWWRDWAGRCGYDGEYRDAVVRSLITLKALTYSPSGGIVAAPTTSLPEQLGGVRNWDYRFCWIRDATFTLLALLNSGYDDEAVAWRQWLLRAVAGEPAQMRIMYGIQGERRLPEVELEWLAGYAGSQPVRVGNEAYLHWQLDVYGELMDALHQTRVRGIPPDDPAWDLQCALMEFLEEHWRDPDNGIWEMRGPRRDFTHSKVMAWIAADRAVKAVEEFGLEGPVERWRRLRSEIFEDVCRNGFDPERNTFTQFYGSKALDGSLLLLSAVGFLPADDPRMKGTVEAVRRDLMSDGFVLRYTMDEHTAEVDALPPGEGAFLPCTFWLADNLIMQGRVEEGRELFERLLGLCNDVGLLAEEYDPAAGRQVGNFPQALSHIALVNTAFHLRGDRGPIEQRAAAGRSGRGHASANEPSALAAGSRPEPRRSANGHGPDSAACAPAREAAPAGASGTGGSGAGDPAAPAEEPVPGRPREHG